MLRRERSLSDNIFNDYMNNDATYPVYTLAEEKIMLKKIKLAFYDELSDEEKEIYLNYYLEVSPSFKQKYLNAGISEQEKILRQFIMRAQADLEEFMRHNLKLVVSLVNDYLHKFPRLNTHKMDLIQEGNAGMLQAIKHFDIEKGAKFSTYAAYWIKNAINAYINDERIIRLPDNVVTNIRKFVVMKAELTDKLLREPSIQELAHCMKLQEPQIIKLQEYYNNFYTNAYPSLNRKLDNDDTEFGELIAADDLPIDFSLEKKSSEYYLIQVIMNSSLLRREKEIIIRHYGLGLEEGESLQDIALELGISLKRAQGMAISGLIKMRRDFYLGLLELDRPKQYQKKRH